MRPFRAALCQVQAHALEDAEANLDGIVRALDAAGAAHADLVALPECSYPAYYVRDTDPYARTGVRPYAEVEALLAAKAKQHGYWLAAGIAVPHADGRLTNSGVVFDPEGTVRGRYDKAFLWHFDAKWFTPGHSFPVFDAGFARFGILICADGRIPEIARSLAVNGAEVILDLTAWVSSGRTMAELTTTQCEYLMPARAFENGCWVLAADKWGTEDGHTVYAGRSSAIDPLGMTRLCAPSDRDEVVIFDVTPMAGEGLVRRPALYGTLTTPTASLPAVRREEVPIAPAAAVRRVAVVPGSEGEWFAPLAMAARYTTLRAQAADLVVFAGFSADGGWRAGLPALEAVVRAHGGALAFGLALDGGEGQQLALLVTPEGVTTHAATHVRHGTPGDVPATVVPTAVGDVGLLCGDEGFVPEVARCLALAGADVLAWPTFAPHPMLERIQRARSDEDRLYVAAAAPGYAMVTSPDGAPLAISPARSGVAMAAAVNLALARSKERAPSTNVIRDRTPEAYRALVE